MLAAFFHPLSFRGTYISMPHPPSTKSVPPSHQIRISPEKSEFDANQMLRWYEGGSPRYNANPSLPISYNGQRGVCESL